jgi:ribonuclease HII
MILGIDEVGRGCLAGPVCVAAVSLTTPIEGLTDSKLLTRQERTKLAIQIRHTAQAVGIGWASHEIIDRLGLTAALRQAALQALQAFSPLAKQILLDGNHNYIGDTRVKTIIHGDLSEPHISAASIIAKVARDNYMGFMAKLYPQYGFESHVGYATPKHRVALQSVGPCTIHRRSFAPVKVLLGVDN